MLLGKEVGGTTRDHDLQPGPPTSRPVVPPLLVDRPRSGPGSYLGVPPVDDDRTRRAVGDAASINKERHSVLGHQRNCHRRDDEQCGIWSRQPARPGEICKSTLWWRWLAEGNEANPLRRITPTYEKWSLYCIRSKQPLHAGEHPFNPLGITRRAAPQRDFTTSCRSHFLGHETKLLDPPGIVALLFIKSSRCAQPRVELPAKPLHDERRAPGAIVAPTAHEALPLTRLNLAEQQRACTTVVGKGSHELFCESSCSEGELVNDYSRRIKEHFSRIGGGGGTTTWSASLLAATELMAVRSVATESGENVIGWKCGKIPERGNPEMTEDLGQLGPIQYFDRLCPQERGRRSVFDDALFSYAIRLSGERRDERPVPDTNPAAHLLSERARSREISFTKGKWRSCKSSRDCITDRANECGLASETAGGAPCRKSCPSGLAKRYLDAELLECPDHVFKGPDLIGEIAGEDDKALTE
jgi:hypothetical protein